MGIKERLFHAPCKNKGGMTQGEVRDFVSDHSVYMRIMEDERIVIDGELLSPKYIVYKHMTKKDEK